MILVIAEQRDGALNRATWEAVVAAQQLAGADDLRIALLGAQAFGAAQELAAAGVGAVLTAFHDANRRVGGQDRKLDGEHAIFDALG